MDRRRLISIRFQSSMPRSFSAWHTMARPIAALPSSRDRRRLRVELRRAIETLLRRPIDLTCAGRTDAGVHAVAQYISVPVTDAELALTRRRWLRAMDALLPKDIAINEVYKARKGFSARFDARSRTYTYRIADRDARPVLSRGAVWWLAYLGC